MRILFFIFAIALMPITSPLADDTEAQRAALAKEYTKLVSMQYDVDRAIDQFVTQVPVEKRVIFRQILKDHIKVDRLELASEVALVEKFTLPELEAMIAFYKTPEGQSAGRKMLDYQAQIRPLLDNMVREAVEAFKRRVQ